MSNSHEKDMGSANSSACIQRTADPTSKAFQFLDLPGEIRNKVYKILLCALHVRANTDDEREDDMFTDVRYIHSAIETNILYTCRTIYHEGRYLMRMTNQTVRVSVPFPMQKLRNMVIYSRIPVLKISAGMGNASQEPVLWHHIFDVRHKKANGPFSNVVFLVRDLSMWIDILKKFALEEPDHEEVYVHTLSVRSPFSESEKPDSFDDVTFNASLLSPYRSLRGFQHINIFNVDSALIKAIRTDMTKERPLDDPTVVVASLEHLKLQGNEAFRLENHRRAMCLWLSGIRQLDFLRCGSYAERMQTHGGTKFARQLITMEFTIHCNLVQLHLSYLRQAKSQPKRSRLLNNVELCVLKVIHDAKTCQFNWPATATINWVPPTTQMVKLLWREAVVCRLIGDLSLVEQAESAINLALNTVVGESKELEEEWKRIIAWKTELGL